MTQKIVISKPGYNAVSETNPDNIVFSSDYNTLKYYTSGTVTLGGTSDNSTTITHGLGFVPFIVIFVQSSVDATYFGMIPYQNSVIIAGTDGYAYADNDKIYFKTVTHGGGSVVSLTFYYKIFKNNLGL